MSLNNDFDEIRIDIIKRKADQMKLLLNRFIDLQETAYLNLFTGEKEQA